MCKLFVTRNKYESLQIENQQLKTENERLQNQLQSGYPDRTRDRISPRNIIPLNTLVRSHHQIIELLELPSNTHISIVRDTNSMDPWIDVGSELFLVPIPQESPFRYEELAIGDVISFMPDEGGHYIHQITNIEVDDQGRKYTTQGINVAIPDPYEIRDNHIIDILVAIFQ